MPSIVKAWKHFIHELDPPRRLGEMPPSMLAALAVVVIGILAALVIMYATRK